MEATISGIESHMSGEGQSTFQLQVKKKLCKQPKGGVSHKGTFHTFFKSGSLKTEARNSAVLCSISAHLWNLRKF